MNTATKKPFIDQFENIAILSAFSLLKKEVSVLEWGSGNSTLYYPKILKKDSYWHAIEHDNLWYKNIKNQIDTLNNESIKITHIEPATQWKPGTGDGTFEEFRNYVLYPLKLGVMFDYIIIDGRARPHCMKAGWEILNSDGIMILHDAQRKIYTRDIPAHANTLRIVNLNKNIEGDISTLFLSKSTKQINLLSILLRSKLPDFIKIYKNNTSIEKNKLYAGNIPEKKKYEDWIGLSLYTDDKKHIVQDITNKLPFTDESIDIFQSEDVFEHIDYQRLRSVINEIHRVLKKEGMFRLSMPDYGCDVLRMRSVLNEKEEIVFDPEGGGTIDNPGHRWFPKFDTVKKLLETTKFNETSTIKYLHYYKPNGTPVINEIDHTIAKVDRTPDFDKRVQNPHRPMSIVIDIIKKKPKYNKIILIGFPKSGTSTFQKAFSESGIKSAHLKIENNYIGQLMYEGFEKHNDPLYYTNEFVALTQIDVCLPYENINFWPQLNNQILTRIRDLHRNCLFILNYRDPEKIVSSIKAWGTLQERLTNSQIQNLPKGIGNDASLKTWISNHFNSMRELFSGDKNFLEIDIESPNAPNILATKLGIDIKWWGVANKNISAIKEYKSSQTQNNIADENIPTVFKLRQNIAKRIYHIHIRKTGGTSINHMFLSLSKINSERLYNQLSENKNHEIRANGLTYVGWNKEIINQGNYFYAFSHIPLHKLSLPSDTFTFTCLRDPAKRIISHYNMIISYKLNNINHPCMDVEGKWAGESFDDFLLNIPKKHLLNQLYMFSEKFDIKEAIYNISKISHIIFTEDMNNGIQQLNSKLKLDVKPIHIRKSKNKYSITKHQSQNLHELLRKEYIFLNSIKNIYGITP